MQDGELTFSSPKKGRVQLIDAFGRTRTLFVDGEKVATGNLNAGVYQVRWVDGSVKSASILVLK